MCVCANEKCLHNYALKTREFIQLEYMENIIYVFKCFIVYFNAYIKLKAWPDGMGRGSNCKDVDIFMVMLI